jgi:hypothetical protein
MCDLTERIARFGTNTGCEQPVPPGHVFLWRRKDQ